MSLQAHQMTQAPAHVLREKSLIWEVPVESLEFAQRLDDEDHLANFRPLFSYPKKRDLPYVSDGLNNDNEECIYLCGQSLGLKPNSSDAYVGDFLQSWGAKGVHSHFNGALPAALSDIPPKAPMARLVGARESEVAVMNGLTVNLHILLCSFYKPTPRRHKIIIEDHAFSSDMYVVKSQINLHGYSIETSLITLKPRRGEYLIREEDALAVIEQEGDEVALILIPGIQYYTGQLFPIRNLTAAAHSKGIIVGCDLAHAAGNVPIYLHEWNVDFAAWCTYKYMNSGAGCIGAIFVNEKFTEQGSNSEFPMLKGWWGNTMSTKFLMRDDFDASFGADMMKMSNPPAVLCALLMASLDIFSQTSMEEIFKKQFLLTGYLEYLIHSQFRKSHQFVNGNANTSATTGVVVNGVANGTPESIANTTHYMPTVDIITPGDPYKRGSQLSLVFSVPLQLVQKELEKRGVVCDVRMPNVMRVAPAPLYNSYSDIYKFVIILKEVCAELDGKFEPERAQHSNIHKDTCQSETPADSPASPASGTSSSNSGRNSGMASSDSEPDSLVDH